MSRTHCALTRPCRRPVRGALQPRDPGGDRSLYFSDDEPGDARGGVRGNGKDTNIEVEICSKITVLHNCFSIEITFNYLNII